MDKGKKEYLIVSGLERDKLNKLEIAFEQYDELEKQGYDMSSLEEFKEGIEKNGFVELIETTLDTDFLDKFHEKSKEYKKIVDNK